MNTIARNKEILRLLETMVDCSIQFANRSRGLRMTGAIRDYETRNLEDKVRSSANRIWELVSHDERAA
jgi:hypothetical protein